MDIQKAVEQTRSDHPKTDVLVAYKDGVSPFPLAFGRLGDGTRAGAVLARLIATPGGEGEWVLVARRTSSAPYGKKELWAAERIAAAGRLVDLPIQAIVLSHGEKVTELTSAKEHEAQLGQ